MQISRKDENLKFEYVSSTSLWNIQGEVLDGPKEISARGTDFQDGTWDFPGDAVASKGLIL